MKVLLLLVMLTTCAASPQDLSDKIFTFPLRTNTAHVKLITSREDFSAVTVCLRSFTDNTRDHILFSLATPSNDYFFMFRRFRENTIGVRNDLAAFTVPDYTLSTWHSICSTWDSESGLAQLWFDGQPSIRKFVSSGSNFTGHTRIVLGQKLDAQGGDFDIDHTFIGMLYDVHMWDHVLSPCEIQDYVQELNFSPGNVLNWRALEFQIVDKVLIENKKRTCY
ncbi:serum amyloid P-component-like isoform X1 [Cottoperca gobio]|uniref:Pentraxin family member n=1 Tax=Cottoperca gobio TaxID=56716 RepID=A0A6J2RCL3_COTGO|nr:serum amyloid P-component-like isoform X1 [Cottoperca gobio]